MSSQRRAITFALVVAVGLIAIGSRRIASRHEQVRLGYELAQARRQLGAADDENRRLRVEHEVLISPERLRPLAAALGMRHPGPGQLRPVAATETRNAP